MLSGEIALKITIIIIKTSPCLDSVIIYQNQHVELTLKLCFFHHIYIYINPKRRELNRFMLRAVHYIILLRCWHIHSQHYATYEQTYIYVFIYVCVYVCM